MNLIAELLHLGLLSSVKIASKSDSLSEVFVFLEVGDAFVTFKHNGWNGGMTSMVENHFFLGGELDLMVGLLASCGGLLHEVVRGHGLVLSQGRNRRWFHV